MDVQATQKNLQQQQQQKKKKIGKHIPCEYSI